MSQQGQPGLDVLIFARLVHPLREELLGLAAIDASLRRPGLRWIGYVDKATFHPDDRRLAQFHVDDPADLSMLISAAYQIAGDLEADPELAAHASVLAFRCEEALSNMWPETPAATANISERGKADHLMNSWVSADVTMNVINSRSFPPHGLYAPAPLLEPLAVAAAQMHEAFQSSPETAASSRRCLVSLRDASPDAKYPGFRLLMMAHPQDMITIAVLAQYIASDAGSGLVGIANDFVAGCQDAFRTWTGVELPEVYLHPA